MRLPESADETADRAAPVVHGRVRRVLGRAERPTDRADRPDGPGRRGPMDATGPIDRSELRVGARRIERQDLPPRGLSGEPADGPYGPGLRHREQPLGTRTAAP